MPVTLRVALVLTVAAMIVAGGVVGYGMGLEAGRAEISTAPEPLPQVRPPSQLGVPNVTGETLEDAADRLVGLEFDVGFRQPPAGEGTGLVGTTDPVPGTIVERGTLVVILEETVDGVLPGPPAVEDSPAQADPEP